MQLSNKLPSQDEIQYISYHQIGYAGIELPKVRK